MPVSLESIFCKMGKDFKINRQLAELLFETAAEAKKLEEIFSGLLLSHPQGVQSQTGHPKGGQLTADKFVNMVIHKKNKVDLSNQNVAEIVDIYKKSVQVDDVTDARIKSIYR